MSVEVIDWGRLLSNLDEPPLLQLAEALAGAVDVSVNEAYDRVEAAIEAGELVEDTETSAFGVIRLPSDDESSELNQQSNDVLVKTSAEPSEKTSKVPKAFIDAIEFFHTQLDTDLSNTDTVEFDTPREAFRDGRGWSDETIDKKRLGWAPPNDTSLLDHLMGEGHDREAILATGLFWDSLEPVWKGRLVLPYFDGEGRPAFAISRRAGEGHPTDRAGDYGDGAAKYHKLPVNAIDECTLSEPIYGADSVEAGEDVLITEGIADAITAHQAGYACLSPVTTSFKLSDRERLAELLEMAGVPRAYIVNDAEQPTSSLRDDGAEGWGRLHIEQYGEGVRGAVRTASHLTDAGIDARIGELPQPAAEKVDLDDYLTRWNGDLRPILARAVSVESHPAYDPKGIAIEAASSVHEFTTETSTSNNSKGSELYDLNIRQVAGVDWGYRGPNPLGHHGESQNYFTLIQDYGLGYDYKYKAAYNPLTYLLVEAGERDAARPNGSLEDSEHFAAWAHAKREGHLSNEDPIPRRALRYVARDAAGWGGELVEHETRDGETFEGMPTDVYNAALEAVENDHGLDHGRRASGQSFEGDDVEHTAVLPPAIRDLATATSGWDWRHTAEHGDDGLTVGEARDRTTAAIGDAYGSGDRVLIEALPTMGKSYGSVKAAAETGEAITILTGRGRKEQYGQFKQWCEDFGLSYYQLPSFVHDCETANGEFGAEWADTVNSWYRRGATPKQIHKAAEYVLGEPLPCQEGEHNCTYTAKWDFEPDDYDVLIGHYAHAHRADKVVNGRSVVIDEFPNAYETTIGPELQGAVSYWLDTTPGMPFDSYTDLVENRSDEARRGEALLWFDEVGLDADEGHVFDDAKAHAAAPLAAYTLLASDDLGNGFEAADLGAVGLGAFNRDRGEVNVLRPPELNYASAVVALDGTPTKRMWELSLGERLNHRRVLQGDERTEYVRNALNLNLIRTTEYVKPYNSADHVNTEADAALLEAIADNHGEKPGVITTTTALNEYDAGEVLDLDRDEHGALTGGVLNGPAEATRWHGNVLGSNEFKSKRVGAVIGSNHYGDGYLKKWGAYAGETVERGDEKGSGLSYGAFGDQVLTHMREHDTLQAAMRFGRDAGGAVVYVHTDTLPDWVPIADEGRVLKTWSDGMRDVVEAMKDLGSATTAEIVEHPTVDIKRRTVYDHLEDLRKRGVLDRHQDPDDGRRLLWADDGIHRLAEHGDVELGEGDFDYIDDDDVGDEVAAMGRIMIYTWNRLNFSDTPPDPPSSRRSTGGGEAGEGHHAGDSPPDWSFADD